MRRPWVAVWAVAGITALLGSSILRLGKITWDAFQHGLSTAAWIAVVAWVIANAYMEGYRGFQKRFVPRVVGRAVEIADHGPWWQVLLAPAVAMGLIAAPRARMIVSWTLVFGIAGIVWIARQLPPAWRGGLDAGVVVGLGWGVIALWLVLGRRLRAEPDVRGIPE